MASGEEIKEVQGEGVSPNLSFAKKLAINDATLKLSNNNEFRVVDFTILSEKAFQEGANYKYIITARGTVLYEQAQDIQPKGTPTKSYAILDNGFRVEILKVGIKKQVVVKDTQGNIILSTEPTSETDDDILLNTAVKVFNESLVKKETQTSTPPPPPTSQPTSNTQDSSTPTNNQKETKESEGEGISPDPSFAKKIAIQNASRTLSSNGTYEISNTTIIDEKVFIEGGNYKYKVKIRATISPK